MTDISLNETTIIASPGVQIKGGPKIDGDNIIWSDKRNGVYYSVWFYNINEGHEVLISNTAKEYGNEIGISGDSIIWTDTVNGQDVLKMIKLDLPKISATITETEMTIEGGTAESDVQENATQSADLFSGIPVFAVIFGLCLIILKKKR